MADHQPVPLEPIASRVKTPHHDPHISPSREAYIKLHKQSLENPDEFWRDKANELLSWYRPFQTVSAGSFERGDIRWFPEGQLNACYNCLDRHAQADPDRTAVIYESDEPGEHEEVSYARLLEETCKLAGVLKSLGVKKGDTVSIYLPMTWYAIAAFLACARLGAIHSVVFAGFSSESLRDRILDCKSRVLITSDEGKRGGKTIATKKIVDVALDELEGKIVEKVVVLKRTGSQVDMKTGRDLWWHEEAAKMPAHIPCETMNAEDPLFILYTSGSTGKPKGVVHTTGGYLLGAAMTLKYVFDVHPGDRFACMADVGWITGHTYIVYAPLVLGVSTTVFESTPVYPTPSRYWETVEKHKLTHFYSAPTAIRLLRRLGSEHVSKIREAGGLSTLRVLGSVGEPINPEAWTWYNEHVGGKECGVVDTFWQTETGSIVIAPIPGAIETKPGSATVPFFGIDPALLDSVSGEELSQEVFSEENRTKAHSGESAAVEGVLVLKRPWPSIARTIWGDHARYLDVYMKPYPGYFYTGDGAMVDEHGYVWIKGRVDDVINVSGHRLSTAEVESALIGHKGVAETAVVGVADEVTGQAVYAFVATKPEFTFESEEALTKELVLQVRKVIGPFAAPKKVYVVSDLPKTRSGKIMRRIMRKIVAGEGDQLGDLSTVAEPGVVDLIKKKVEGDLKK